ncbi:restriction endonuclease subunit S [Winogradskyella sp. SYSU M77433]|uniref:restriction endonuclease subunit S n=1 Tax=Winogradskyella sp. SYSU M77433 TaxID=3042722 RepID=UPI00248126E5|nr:restriction endonuclease subunit S [Winogradskyella sp. SYSU M77433]MDH7914334.1 restriction endonuclease subunit S [Winogradskyella sp. SYSU M77433]
MANSKWKKEPLKKLCYRIGDGLHGTPNYSDNTDIFFINGNNLKNGKIVITENTNTVSKEELENNYIALNENTLLLSINGTLGSMAFYNNETVMLGKSAAYLNFKTNINRFYYYYFQLDGVQQYFHNVATGSTIKNLSLKSIQDFEVPVPDDKEWQSIVSILSSLDSKIELNNKINSELEKIAKTIYEYWFVQFDFPDVNGKPYKSFGGKMIYNEILKREIPFGWKLKALNDIESNIITGKTPSTKIKENFDGDIPFITIDDIRQDTYIYKTERTLTKKGAETQSNKYLDENDICVSCIGTVGIIGFVGKKSQTNQQINTISTPKEYNRYYLFQYLNDFFNFNSAAKKGAVLSNMNKGDFEAIPVIDPDKYLKQIYFERVDNIFKTIANNIKQNQKLVALRDWLLPMLMNGQVTVKEAQEHINQAAEPQENYSINSK